MRNLLPVSIHAPTGGATGFGLLTTSKVLKFQSTRPRGARPIDTFWASGLRPFQSTRPRGARPLGRMSTCRTSSFNPRAHGGRDEPNPPQKYSLSQFQSTRPRGARRTMQSRLCRSTTVSIHAPTGGATSHFCLTFVFTIRFNPRAHGGRDRRDPSRGVRGTAFQSTRPRGARRAHFISPRIQRRVSIHAPTGGATPQRPQ